MRWLGPIWVIYCAVRGGLPLGGAVQVAGGVGADWRAAVRLDGQSLLEVTERAPQVSQRILVGLAQLNWAPE